MIDLLDPLIDATHKGFPAHCGPLRRSAIGSQGWNVLAGDLPLPLAVIKRRELDHNLGWMRRYAAQSGVRLAPHGKTTMSPQLFKRQLDEGAWGLTFANVAQLRVGVLSGVRHCLIANQVFAPVDLAAIASLRRDHPGLRVVFLLDSLTQLELIEATQPKQVFEVLIELGMAQGRTGCRTHDEAIELARRAHRSASVKLVGVECYEGLGAKANSDIDRATAHGLMQRVTQLAQQCDREGLFEGSEVIVSAGGSAIFDLVVPSLKPALSRPVLPLMRSGCYVTHDHGMYRRLVLVVNQRMGCDANDPSGLQAAMEVWTHVQSLPEPGLAILTAGRRDVSYDVEMPIPIAYAAHGEKALQPAPADWKVKALNDQHAHLRFDVDAGLAVGDRVVLGISHPCTTFDKWRWMPVVDERYNVVDALVTCF
jgi:D-serine dehydratase